MKRNLTNYLSEGEANAITARDLKQLLQYESIREVSMEISRLRIKGELICSSTLPGKSGYYIPETISEVERFCKSMRHRIAEIDKAIKPAEAYLKKMGGE